MEHRPDKPSWAVLRFQIFAVACAALNYMPVGIGFAFSSILLPPDILKDEVEVFGANITTDNSTSYKTHGNTTHYLNVGKTDASWIASLLPLSSVVGSFLSGPCMERFGRKTLLMISATLNILGWSLTIGSANWLALVYIARIVNGFSEGKINTKFITISSIVSRIWKMMNKSLIILGLTTVCFVYVAEISHSSVRATFLATIAGASSLAILTLIGQSFVPETPHWIIAHVDDVEKRERELTDSLKWLYRDPMLYEQQLQQIRKLRVSKANPSNEDSAIYWKPLIILAILQFFQMLSGAYVVIVYAFQLFEGAGARDQETWILLMLVGVLRLLGAVFSTFNYFGRRQLLISSCIGMTFSMYLATFFILQYSPCLMAAILVFIQIAFSTFGLLPIPATLIGELLPHETRGKFSGYFFAYGYGIVFIAIKVLLYYEQAVGLGYVFLTFGTFSAVAGIFTLFVIPETRNRPLEEIQKELRATSGIFLQKFT